MNVGTVVLNQTEPPSLVGIVVPTPAEGGTLAGFVHVAWSDGRVELEQVEDITLAYRFAPGDRITFDTHGGDSDLGPLSGQTGLVERTLRQSTPLMPDSEADSIIEVGPMYVVRLTPALTIHAFEDELEVQS